MLSRRRASGIRLALARLLSGAVVALVATATTVGAWPAAPPAGAATVGTSVGTSVAQAPRAAGDPSWLVEINRYRTAAGLAPVTDQTAWDLGLQHHLAYLAGTPAGYFTGQYQSLHTENPASPYYTADGAREAGASDLMEGNVGLSDVQVIDMWLRAPFHAIGMLRPQLTQVAFAYDPATGDGGLDVISGLVGSGAHGSPILFPGPGMTTDLATFSGGELPNPLDTCGWAGAAAVGLPVVALLPSDPVAGLTARLVGPGGAVESVANGLLCVVDDHTFTSSDPVYGPTGSQLLSGDHAVFLIPRLPLTTGLYLMTISQPGQPDISWPFGTAIPLSQPVTGMASLPDGAGYWIVNAFGDVSAHGAATYLGSMAGLPLAAPISHIVSTPDGGGYWLIGADGGVFTFGDAGFYGSMGGIPLNAPVVDLAPTPDGRGYWLVASDGGVFAFGDATFRGSMGGTPLNAPVVGITASGGGYRMVAADGGIFSFGAAFYGSMGGMPLNRPIVGMAGTASGGGYWLVASDGGVFTFGDAGFHGSTGSIALVQPVVGMAADRATGGYWLVAADGGIFSLGAPFDGAD